MKATQKEYIKKELIANKIITRNELLRMYISRGAARIEDLRKEGMIITGKKQGNDYIYTYKGETTAKGEIKLGLGIERYFPGLTASLNKLTIKGEQNE